MSALDLQAVSEEFLNQCGSCDAGLPTNCVCSRRDYRPTMLALVRELEQLRAFVGAAQDRTVSRLTDI
jgi:hypothetical protein